MLDFSNAFNSIFRHKMLQSVSKLSPSLYSYVHLAYSSLSTLFWAAKLISSEEGIQQVDPLGPLLFCLSIHNLVERLKSEFHLFYLDDGILGGDVPSLKEDIELLTWEGAELGLILNSGKSEVISPDSNTIHSIQTLLGLA